jgi:hypothetical protein
VQKGAMISGVRGKESGTWALEMGRSSRLAFGAALTTRRIPFAPSGFDLRNLMIIRSSQKE